MAAAVGGNERAAQERPLLVAPLVDPKFRHPKWLPPLPPARRRRPIHPNLQSAMCKMQNRFKRSNLELRGFRKGLKICP
eukprot:15481497-Alexandrium_andersonii.AAC.1